MNKQILLVALLCIGSLAIAQKTETATREYTQRIPKTLADEGIFGIAVPCTETYHYYYDADDNRIKHGLSSITGVYNITRNGVTIDEKFNGTANYSDGKLNGKVQQSYSIVMKGRGESIKINWDFSGGYVDGLADGVWTYNETNAIDQKKKKESEHETITISFSKGKVSSITYNDGVKNTVDDNGYVTGQWDGFRIKNNMVTNYFKRKNGDVSKVETEQENLINGLVNGDYSTQDIIDQGYSIYSKEEDMLGYFCSRVGNSYYVNLDYLGGFFVPEINNQISILTKVNLASFEDVKAAITSFGSGDVSSDSYKQINKQGCIYKNGVAFYLSSETKQRMDDYYEEKMEVKREELMTLINKTIETADSKEKLKKEYRDVEPSMQLLREEQKKELLTKYQRKLYEFEQIEFDLIMREIKSNFSQPFPLYDYIRLSGSFTYSKLKTSLEEALEKQPSAIEASLALRKALDQIVLVSEKRKITKDPVKTITTDFNTNASQWEVFVGELSDLPEQIAPFCPMSSYSIISTDEYLKDGSFSYIVEWTKAINKKEQIKYSSIFVVTRDKKHVDLNSFDFSKATMK